ncbi:MAG: HEAT repeat domain-containing protein [Elusimicrobiota bacterium]
MKKILKENEVMLTALLLQFATISAVVIARTFVDQLFLSTYPQSWLPYYFFGQTAVLIILTFGITPVISKGKKIISTSVFFFASATVILSLFILKLGLSWFPFVFSLWLSAVSIIIAIISMGSIGEAFDTRDFKQKVKWISAAGSLGGLTIGFMIPVIISEYGSDSLLYILTIMMLFSAGCIFRLKPIPADYKKLKRGTSPLKYPIFLNLAIGVFLLMIIDTFADYALKTQVMAVYSEGGIGKFMGPFYGVASILTLCFQLGGTGPLLKYAGIAGLFCVVPIFSIISSIGILAYPALWMAVFFRMTENVFRYSFDDIAREISASPLPAQIRRTSKIFMKGIATPMGTGTGALLLLLISGRFGLRAIALITIPVSILWFMAIRKITGLYQVTLSDAVKIKRFAVDSDDIEKSDKQINYNIALEALKSGDPDSIRFGLMLFEKSPPAKFPPEMLKLIDSEDTDIRRETVKTMGLRCNEEAAKSMIDRLSREKDPGVIWHIMKAVSSIYPESLISQAAELLDDPHPDVKAGAVLVLMESGELDTLIDAVTVLREMISSPNADYRRSAARVIGALKSGKLEKELRKLMNDDNNEVIIAAVRAAGVRRVNGLIPDIIMKLKNSGISHYASRTLVNIGSDAIPLLADAAIDNNNRAFVKIAVRTLALISDESAEKELIRLAESSDVITSNTVARETAFRVRRQPVSGTLKKTARRFVIETARKVQLLKSARKELSLEEHVKAELSSRQRLFEMKMLYWYAAATRPAEVIDIMPALFPRHITRTSVSRRSTAIELLDSLATDRELRHAVELYEKNIVITPAAAIRLLKSGSDTWIKDIFDYKYPDITGGAMDIRQKIMFLRKVKLFETLPGEILLTIAEEVDTLETAEGQEIFSQGDPSDGFYIIASGSVSISRNGRMITELGEYGFFGEVGLLGNSPRTATATAKTDGFLIYVDKEIFDSITEDLPEVLRAVTQFVVGYLRNESSSAIE